MKLRRAIASFLKTHAPQLSVHARRPYGKNLAYPLATFTVVGRETSVLGCGDADYRQRNESGNVVKKGRLVQQETSLRIDLWVPADAEKSAEERIEELAEDVERVFEDWRFDRNRSAITDPTSGDDLHVTAMCHVSTVDLPLDTGGEPFLARKSLTYAIAHRRYHERDVERHIENINLRYGA